MADNKYPQGLKGFQKRDGAPDFALGTLIIEPRALFDWFKTDEGRASLKDYNGTKQAKFSILKSKQGNFLNFAVDNYDASQSKPKQQSEPAQNQSNNSRYGDDSGGLPF